MQLTAKQLCDLLGGELEGDSDVVIDSPAKIEEAQAHQVSFIANPKYVKYASTTKAGILIVDEDFIAPNGTKATLIRVKNAYQSVTALLKQLEQKPKKSGIEQPSFIAASAKVANTAYIGAFAYIGENVVIADDVQIYPHTFIGDGSSIGENSILYSGVKIYHNCVVGRQCILHSGVVVGSDGFGFAPTETGFDKVPQTGNVIIEDDVEIGANSTIDRATMGSTVIHKGVKIDNLVMLAHNTEVGENTVIAAQAGISGSTKVGRQCMIGGQAGFVGHIDIADGVKVQAQSGVSFSIKDKNKAVAGTPAFDYGKNQRANVIFRKLPELDSRINKLEKATKQNDKQS